MVVVLICFDFENRRSRARYLGGSEWVSEKENVMHRCEMKLTHSIALVNCTCAPHSAPTRARLTSQPNDWPSVFRCSCSYIIIVVVVIVVVASNFYCSYSFVWYSKELIDLFSVFSSNGIWCTRHLIQHNTLLSSLFLSVVAFFHTLSKIHTYTTLIRRKKKLIHP